jgi:hypothetical protein
VIDREHEPDPEERARRAEEALAKMTEERNRLWAELQGRKAMEADLEFWRDRSESIERSRWWRAGKPLRVLKIFRRDPAGVLNDQAAKIRQRRRGA